MKRRDPRPPRRLVANPASAHWLQHAREWRDPAQIASQWHEASETNPQLLQYTVRAPGGNAGRLQLTLLVTREYEHLVMAMCVNNTRPHVSYMRLPHPSGLAVDNIHGTVYVASTRNPQPGLRVSASQTVRPEGGHQSRGIRRSAAHSHPFAIFPR